MVWEIQVKALELSYRLRATVEDQNGQTATEYVAITAVALTMAVVVTWQVLSGGLTTAIESMLTRVGDFVSGTAGPL